MSGYNVLTVTHNGTVSLLKGLSKDEAIEAGRRLTPFHQHPDWRCPPGGYSWMPSDGHIERLEVWGPDGVALDIWNGYESARD